MDAARNGGGGVTGLHFRTEYVDWSLWPKVHSDPEALLAAARLSYAAGPRDSGAPRVLGAGNDDRGGLQPSRAVVPAAARLSLPQRWEALDALFPGCSAQSSADKIVEVLAVPRPLHRNNGEAAAVREAPDVFDVCFHWGDEPWGAQVVATGGASCGCPPSGERGGGNETWATPDPTSGLEAALGSAIAPAVGGYVSSLLSCAVHAARRCSQPSGEQQEVNDETPPPPCDPAALFLHDDCKGESTAAWAVFVTSDFPPITSIASATGAAHGGRIFTAAHAGNIGHNAVSAGAESVRACLATCLSCLAGNASEDKMNNECNGFVAETRATSSMADPEARVSSGITVCLC